MATQERSRGAGARTAEDVLQMPASGDMPDAAGVGTGMHLMTQAAPFQLREVRKERDLAKVLKNVALMADQFGDAPGSRWVYSWMTKNRDGSRSEVKGGTIKMANAIAALYGNCDIDVRVIDEGARWVFYARFVDLETGFSTVRAYQQRKEQTIGMKDAQRALDIVFQIGQSKALRNVILNAIPHVAAYAMDAALESNYKKVAGKPEEVRERIKLQLAKFGPTIQKRVEQAYARTAQHWTVQDMSRMVGEIESILEGMANVDEVWPLETDADNGPIPDTNAGAGANAAMPTSSSGGTGGNTTRATGAPGKNEAMPTAKPGAHYSPGDQRGGGDTAETGSGSYSIGAGGDRSPQREGDRPALRILLEGETIATTLKHDLKTGDPIEIAGKGLFHVEQFVVNEETTLPDIHVKQAKAVPLPTAKEAEQPKPAATKKGSKPMFGED